MFGSNSPSNLKPSPRHQLVAEPPAVELTEGQQMVVDAQNGAQVVFPMPQEEQRVEPVSEVDSSNPE